LPRPRPRYGIVTGRGDHAGRGDPGAGSEPGESSGQGRALPQRYDEVRAGRLRAGRGFRKISNQPAPNVRHRLSWVGHDVGQNAFRKAARLGGVGRPQLGDSAACIPEFRLVVSIAEADHAQGRDTARRLGSNHGDHSAPEPRRVGLEPSPRRERRGGSRRE